MIKERTELTNDEIIEAYLMSCKRRVKEIKEQSYTKTEEKPEVKKKSETKIKKLYPSYSKIALLLGSILVLGALFTSLFVPDIGHVIYAILESLDPFKGFRGNGNLEPDNYVMFLK